ncbi:hypothetical protein HMPREF9372_1202 [Sporosarcina newyorkensis 2681]|uniref:Transglutaminase-like domain-containing protein n=1 Tax=Sporosarcina newyorkensis 2681 TaxID=1027292 RepID=F9DQX2_9BACL|nr:MULTISPECIES: DUF5050 domain-containing protein [Sporosarcina]EGQ26811.1 hypothetical protein HMPREF9372_1202 [Sporosarcina newyorkensis 2681]MBY0221628.1 DUF5050 domain-containing protein [Sporosarcina aquimarina]
MNKSLTISFTFLLSLFLFVHPADADVNTTAKLSISEETAIAKTAGVASNSYNMILEALLHGEETGYFDTAEVSYKEVGSIIKAVTNEHPEVMYYSGATLWSNGKIEFKYSKPPSVVRANQSAVQNETSKVLSSIIKPGSSDFDKVKAIHDYLALHNAYDYDNFRNNTVPADSYTAYGALITGIAVCDGYTKAAQLLMNQLGIENQYVFGYGNGGAHSWNLVKLDGQYYFMDITWDDPVPNTPGNVRYDYFLVTSKVLRKDHSWNEASWPVASSSKYAYFNDFGKLIEDGNTYYYSSNSDNAKLYRVNKDGTAKQKINDVQAPYFALAGDWIYFSNYSHSGYLFKMKKDGSSKTQLNDHHSTDLRIEGKTLYYVDRVTGKETSLAIEIPDEIPQVKPVGEVVKPSKTWTITFNQEVDPLSLTKENIFVKTSTGDFVPVTIQLDRTDAHKVQVYAPTGGYDTNQNYTLTVRKVSSKLGLPLKESKTKDFHVQ